MGRINLDISIFRQIKENDMGKSMGNNQLTGLIEHPKVNNIKVIEILFKVMQCTQSRLFPLNSIRDSRKKVPLATSKNIKNIGKNR